MVTKKIQDKRRNLPSRDIPILPPDPPANVLERISRPPHCILMLCGLVLICYFQTLFYDFTRFDDDLILTDNIQTYRDISKIADSFSRDAFNIKGGSAFYRPIQNLSFFLDAQLSGLNPIGYKITNLSLHALTCISIWYLLLFLRLDYRSSFLAALIYAAHPLFSHAVIWIPGRGDLFLALFSVWAYISFLEYERTRKSRYLLLHAIAFALACFSKETALLLPLIFLVHLFTQGRREKGSRPYFSLLLCWTMITVTYFLLRSRAVLMAPHGDELGIGPLIHNWPTPFEFLAKFIVPIHLSVMPIFNTFTIAAGIVLLGLLGWHAFRSSRQSPVIPVVGMCWFVFFTAFTMIYRHKLGLGAYDYLEHRAYLPMIGVLMILTFFIQIWIKQPHNKLVFVAGFVIAGLCAATTIVHGRQYADPMTFYSAAIRSNPICAVAYYNRAKFRQSHNDRAGAMADYNKAIEVKPDCSPAYINRGNAKKNYGDVKGALLDYDEAVKWDSESALAYLNRGNARLVLGNTRGAWEDYTQVIRLDPARAQAFSNRGTIYVNAGQLELAYQDFSRALESDPTYADAWMNRGTVRFSRKDVSGACSDWQMAQRAGHAEAANLIRQNCR